MSFRKQEDNTSIHSLDIILDFLSNNGADIMIECIEDVILQIIAGVIPINNARVDDSDFGFDGSNAVKILRSLGYLAWFCCCWLFWQQWLLEMMQEIE